MSDKKKIIWLEDKLGYNDEFLNIFNTSGYQLITCQTLGDFKQALADSKPEEVAGFILDILISVDNLEALDFPAVNTSMGNDTGVSVLRYYLRNLDEDSPVESAWANHKVLMLTTLSIEFVKVRYRDFIVWEEKHKKGLTTWLSKADEQGDKQTSIKSVHNWLACL